MYIVELLDFGETEPVTRNPQINRRIGTCFAMLGNEFRVRLPNLNFKIIY